MASFLMRRIDIRPFPLAAAVLYGPILAGDCYTFPELLSSPIWVII
jgi:hypothetical protein